MLQILVIALDIEKIKDKKQRSVILILHQDCEFVVVIYHYIYSVCFKHYNC